MPIEQRVHGGVVNHIMEPTMNAKTPSRLQAQAAALTVTAWAAAQSPSHWRRLAVREGEKGMSLRTT
ncbi:MAG: hypothetical protein Q8O37_17250 [Sulfuricellaceae bacterium]|nr:hypothetical protein [Sulfuricellaceae bacterium]